MKQMIHTFKMYQELIMSTPVAIASQISKNLTRCLIKRRRKDQACSEPKSIKAISVPKTLKNILWIFYVDKIISLGQ